MPISIHKPARLDTIDGCHSVGTEPTARKLFACAIIPSSDSPSWDDEWYGRHYRERAPNQFAEFVLWPDGRVTFTQRQEPAPDRVITIRGERVSGVAWECSGRSC